MKDDKLYLIHITECLDKIDLYLKDGNQIFYSDPKTQDAVLRNLQIMAESTQRLSDMSKKLRPEIEWAKIVGFRNILVHQYLGVDPKQVMHIIEQELPQLRKAVAQILEARGDSPS